VAHLDRDVLLKPLGYPRATLHDEETYSRWIHFLLFAWVTSNSSLVPLKDAQSRGNRTNFVFNTKASSIIALQRPIVSDCYLLSRIDVVDALIQIIEALDIII
jgi:hypothetical protein